MKPVLIGDIGGTHTRLMVFSPAAGVRAPQLARHYASREYPSLEAILSAFGLPGLERPARAVFGIAGPVSQTPAGPQVAVTHLPWRVTAASLRHQFGFDEVTLLNDVQATACGLPFLQPRELLTLNSGSPVAHGPRALIAAGTGLGEAFLWRGPQGWQACPSEGGHVSFAPVTDLQIHLLRFLSAAGEHVSVEQVCSGLGIINLYRFFETLPPEPGISPIPEVCLTDGSDPVPAIVDAAQAQPAACPVSRRAIETFIDILAAAAGNLALKVMATGGVYIAGGLPFRLQALFDPQRFMIAFQAKGPKARWLAEIPVHIICHPEPAVFGAACYALEGEYFA